MPRPAIGRRCEVTGESLTRDRAIRSDLPIRDTAGEQSDEGRAKTSTGKSGGPVDRRRMTEAGVRRGRCGTARLSPSLDHRIGDVRGSEVGCCRGRSSRDAAHWSRAGRKGTASNRARGEVGRRSDLTAVRHQGGSCREQSTADRRPPHQVARSTSRDDAIHGVARRCFGESRHAFGP